MPVVSLPSEKVPAPPLSELDVGGGVQQPRVPEPLHIRRPGIHIFPPLQHHAGQAVPGQKQGGEQPRRSHAHHHRGQGGLAPHWRKGVGLPLHQLHVLPRGVLHQSRLPGHGQLHRIHIVDVIFVPGVDGRADDLQFPQRPGAHPQGPGRPLPQLLQIPAHGQGKISDLDHKLTFSQPSRMLRAACRWTYFTTCA